MNSTSQQGNTKQNHRGHLTRLISKLKQKDKELRRQWITSLSYILMTKELIGTMTLAVL